MVTIAAPSLPAFPQAPSNAVPVARWPQISAEEREVAQALADRVISERDGEPASVHHEERLPDDVARTVERAIASPSSSGLPLAVVSELAANPAYRAIAMRNALILASHLWPLSLLIYGGDLENITCLGHDRWLVSVVGRKLSLVGDSPFASDEECLEFFRRAVRRRFEERFDATRMAKNYVNAYRGLSRKRSNQDGPRSILPPQLNRHNGSGAIHHVD